ncbi:MAG: L,D-transpeptidase family protein [Anaerolineales bacterium]|nr:L,D-transpeptidase family protein [Chloroflexota bacterium]MBL6982401.1 L,D-transpeptidase family protein [Anaerolineales bacterium]
MNHKNSSHKKIPFSRRDFLKFSAVGVGGFALKPWRKLFQLTDFPQSEKLGRVSFGKIDVKAQPDYDSQTVSVLFEDAVVPWLREVSGRWPYRNNQRWVETPEGYIWCPYLQPVKNEPAQPVNSLLQMGDLSGLWVEVSVPYVDAIIANGPPRSAWWQYRLENGQSYRFYYSQILWVDQMKTESDGSVWYRINERYGNPGDIFWCPAEAFRPLTAEELSPISPNVEDKRIEVDINWQTQTLSCYEGNTEVYFARISSGKAEGATPLTPAFSPGFQIWRKLFSLHMGGNTAAGAWDVPAVGWTSLFHGDGVAVHSTYWHNNYGEPMSHGCINARPEDAKWIFRWANPVVSFETGDLTIVSEGGTRVIVNEW